AEGTFPPAENLWNVVQTFDARFVFANGVELTCRTDQPYLRFEGEEGTITVRYPNDIRCDPPELLEWTPGPDDLRLPFKHSEKRDFLGAVASRSQPLYGAEAGHRAASLSHLALAAIERGRGFR